MNNETRQNLLDQVKATIENLDQDTEPLDVEYLVKMDKSIKDIILTTTVGGPRIDIHLGTYTVKGYWNSEEIDYPIFENESEIRSKFDNLFYYYKELFNV